MKCCSITLEGYLSSIITQQISNTTTTTQCSLEGYNSYGLSFFSYSSRVPYWFSVNMRERGANLQNRCAGRREQKEKEIQSVCVCKLYEWMFKQIDNKDRRRNGCCRLARYKPLSCLLTSVVKRLFPFFAFLWLSTTGFPNALWSSTCTFSTGETTQAKVNTKCAIEHTARHKHTHFKWYTEPPPLPFHLVFFSLSSFSFFILHSSIHYKNLLGCCMPKKINPHGKRKREESRGRLSCNALRVHGS